MGSSLIVEICRVDAVEPHPNADRLAIATIKGWKTCIRRQESGEGEFSVGDLCVYIPPDVVMPFPLADRLGMRNYLKSLGKSAGPHQMDAGRVSVARLRGQPSYGMITKLDILPPRPEGWSLGDDVAAVLGLSKWEPPIVSHDGDTERANPVFHRYVDLENYRNFPDLIPDGEPVVVTEKLHGKNCRVGRILEASETGELAWTWAAGSHALRRKEFGIRHKSSGDPDNPVVEEILERSQFWQALDTPGVREMILAISQDQHNVIVFGEIFGSGVQDMTYGMTRGQWTFRVFDITVDGSYLPFAEKVRWCEQFAVPTVPILFDGPFSAAMVEQLVTGPTTICPKQAIQGFAGREGIVITAKEERPVFHQRRHFPRMALKAISFEYLERKNGTEFH
ncbi:RNA ligase family protein [Tuwongella immobilis]|uniref:RNA ligase domain-containing protein n=1 Tax=Tuwongella immobilis TaxID=692036 RepID=A0A6C2YJ79_9BACT|nr:RNA ligase family protein [Tuwongella immobilis]VIP01155.1 RNA ligase, DRB0094 family OS=Ktedonobacter racemifer DSM 44963 GN=Krac_9999 PE=4 SV=1: RNA_ligase [Tuwongella immobilis]VTR97736.1 RNA ligase, DRB0094 family OS=Ktedonobacter racemifer DSM 44963 GN=Krac_9999 PE=4 SV=1: RNA_ligase [Tuwongella immobilis]